MPPAPSIKTLIATVAIGAALPALADSLSASSAAGGSSASSASSAASSASESSQSSSDGSGGKQRAMADGPYRIVDVAPRPDRPGVVRVTLQALDDPDEGHRFRLELPHDTLARAGLAAGDTVRARQRPYGVQLANAATERAFFLLLHDDWAAELTSNPVVL